MGRPRKTYAELRLTGGYRPDRHGPEAVRAVPRDAAAKVAEQERLDAARARVSAGAGLAFFDRLADAYTDWTAHDVELLVAGAALTSTITEAERILDAEGLVVDRRGGSVRHPATIVLASARTELRQTLRALGLDR